MSAPGRYADGGGLYLVVDASGAKRWAFLYRWKADPSVPGAGRIREMGLGGLSVVTLAEARDAAEDARRLKHKGIDPITSRKRTSDTPTFGIVADQVIEVKSQSMRSDKSVARIKRSLEQDAAPLRSMRIDAISTAEVLAVLQPIWSVKASSAQMTRGYIEAVFDAAKARGFRSGENPARWRGHLDQLLSAKRKLTRGHHKAMAFAEVPAFMSSIRTDPKIVASALEFLILTAARTSEVLGSRWSEIDWDARLWIIPGPRMKMAREHRVPLSPRALEILTSMRGQSNSEFIFPGRTLDKPMSNMAFEMFLRRRAMPITTHGFRSSFRDWVGEETSFEREVAEAALAHITGDATERAYRRGNALGKRAVLMNAWADYCGGLEKVSTLKAIASG